MECHTSAGMAHLVESEATARIAQFYFLLGTGLM